MAIAFIKGIESFTVTDHIYYIYAIALKNRPGFLDLSITKDNLDVLIESDEPSNIILDLVLNKIITNVNNDDIPNIQVQSLRLIKDCLEPLSAQLNVAAFISTANSASRSSITYAENRLTEYPEHGLDALEFIEDNLIAASWESLSFLKPLPFTVNSRNLHADLSNFLDWLYEFYYQREACIEFSENFESVSQNTLTKVLNDKYNILELNKPFLKLNNIPLNYLEYVEGSLNISYDFEALKKECRDLEMTKQIFENMELVFPKTLQQPSIFGTVDFKVTRPGWFIPNNLMDEFKEHLWCLESYFFFWFRQKLEMSVSISPNLIYKENNKYRFTYILNPASY